MYDCTATFPAITGLPDPAASVNNVYGQKNAKEDCARLVYALLEGIMEERERKMAEAGISLQPPQQPTKVVGVEGAEEGEEYQTVAQESEPAVEKQTETSETRMEGIEPQEEAQDSKLGGVEKQKVTQEGEVKAVEEQKGAQESELGEMEKQEGTQENGVEEAEEEKETQESGLREVEKQKDTQGSVVEGDGVDEVAAEKVKGIEAMGEEEQEEDLRRRLGDGLESAVEKVLGKD